MFCLRPPPSTPIDLDSPTHTQDLHEAQSASAISDFALTSDPRLKTIETAAREAYLSPSTPTAQNILQCFAMLPRSHLKPGPEGSSFVIGGSSPRSRYDIVAHSRNLPFFNLLVTRFIRSIAPQHAFTTYVLRTGAIDKPHRDVRNAPLPTLIVALSTPNPEEDGLWIQDIHGLVTKQHLGASIRGSVLSLQQPLLFQPRSFLHAGHVHDTTRVGERVILVAFSTLHASVLHWDTRDKLSALGFRLPSTTELYKALHGSIPGDPPRMKQLTMHEFLLQGVTKFDDHDVIGVLDSGRGSFIDDTDEVEVVD